MSNQSGYKKQQNLSFIQFLSELPSFIVTLISAIVSNTMLLFVDLMDSFGNLLRTATVTVLSKKLTGNLNYKYNYGIGKIEAITSLFCNCIVFFGLLLTIGLSVRSIIYPEMPSKSVIAVVGIKVINVCFDISFFAKQREILKVHKSSISEANYAAAFAALLFDSITLISLLTIWVLRNNPVVAYISPVISIFFAIYLILGCIKRTKKSLSELSDKTLPEEEQIKILKILTRHYDSYSQFHSINSHKIGELVEIDLHISFEANTSFGEISALQKQLQSELNDELGNCTVNIIVHND